MPFLENNSVPNVMWNTSGTFALNNKSSTNLTNEEYEDNVIPTDYQNIAFGLIAMVGIVGNAVVIFVIIRSVSMREKFTNILILNQSSIDLATSLVLLLTKTLPISKTNLSGLGGDILCRFWLNEMPLWSLMVSSSYSLMAITFERYLGIVHPLLHYTSFTKRHVVLLAIAAWFPGPILMSCFWVPTYAIVNGRCYSTASYDSPLWKHVRGVLLFFFEYLIPIAVFIICYCRMLYSLRSQVQPESTANGLESSAPNARAKRNVLKTLLLVVVAYLVCNSFNQITFLAYNFGAPLDFTSYYYSFTVIAMFSNSCINPFVYALQYRPYQNELRKVFCCRGAMVAVGSF